MMIGEPICAVAVYDDGINFPAGLRSSTTAANYPWAVSPFAGAESSAGVMPAPWSGAVERRDRTSSTADSNDSILGGVIEPLLAYSNLNTPTLWVVRPGRPVAEYPLQWLGQGPHFCITRRGASQYITGADFTGSGFRTPIAGGARAVAVLGLATLVASAVTSPIGSDAASLTVAEASLVRTANAVTIAGLSGSRVWRDVDQIKNPHERARATAIVHRLISTIAAVHTRNREIPPLHTSHSEDGALVLEWRFPDRRLGIAFEVQQDESGWYLVDLRSSPGIQACGTLRDIDIPKLVRAITYA